MFKGAFSLERASSDGHWEALLSGHQEGDSHHKVGITVGEGFELKIGRFKNISKYMHICELGGGAQEYRCPWIPESSGRGSPGVGVTAVVSHLPGGLGSNWGPLSPQCWY